MRVYDKSLTLSEFSAICPLGLPFAAVCLGIIAGYSGCGFVAALVCISLAALSVGVIMWIASRSIVAKTKARNWYLLPVALGFVGLGIGVWRLFSPPETIPADAAHQFATARVTDYKATTSGDVLQVEILYFSGSNDDVARLNAPIKAVVYTDANTLRRGDVICFRNFLEPIENEGSYDDSYARSMFSRGFAWKQSVPSERIKKIDYSPTLSGKAADLRDRIVVFIDRTPLSSESKGFLEALLLGDRSGLAPEVYDDFASAGVAHLLALSGMHLAIVSLILSMVLMPLAYFIGRKSRYLILLVGIWMFAVLTGLSVSVVRAAIMTSVFFFSMIVERKRTGINALCAAGIIILLTDPPALFNIGSQLSFTICVALLLLARYLDEMMYRSYGRRYMLVHSEWGERHPRLLKLRLKADYRKRQIWGACCVALVSFASSWMLTAYYFHKVSLMFLPANLVAGMLVWIIFIAAACYLPLYAVGLAPALLGRFLDFVCRLLGKWCETVAGWQDSTQFVAVDSWAVAAYMGALMLFTIWAISRRGGWLWCSVAAAAVTTAIILANDPNVPRCGLEVGQRKGEISIENVAGNARTTVRYPRGEVSKIAAAEGDVVIADCENLPMPDYTGKCRLMIVGRGGEKNVERLIEIFRPKEVALIDEESLYNKEKLDSLELSGNLRIKSLAKEKIFVAYD